MSNLIWLFSTQDKLFVFEHLFRKFIFMDFQLNIKAIGIGFQKIK